MSVMCIITTQHQPNITITCDNNDDNNEHGTVEKRSKSYGQNEILPWKLQCFENFDNTYTIDRIYIFQKDLDNTINLLHLQSSHR